MVRTSAPLGVPDKPIPNVYVCPLPEILVGVALDKVATPPAIDKAKSLASKEPLPLAVLNTISSRVTTTVALSFAKVTLVMDGAT